MTALQVFQYQESQIRTIQKDGEPWFVANDVAAVLGYADRKQAVSDHCKCAILLKGVESTPLTDSPRGITIIPERDVYRMIMRSKLPSAVKFEEWVVSEVLPSIRKTGSYTQLTEIEVARRYVAALEDRDRLQQQITEQAPKVEAFDAFIDAKNCQPMNIVAKALGVGRNLLFERLRKLQVLMNNNLPYQRFIDAGYFTVREVTLRAKEANVAQTLVTAKGVEFIRRSLQSHIIVS
jgi:anti-repressor protein